MAPRIIGGTAGRTMQIRLVDGVGAGGQAAPALETDGFDLRTITREFKYEDRGLICIHKAGDGTALEIASATMWGFYSELEAGAGPNDWGPVGSENETIARGALNEGLPIAQVGTSKIMLLESVGGLRTLEMVATELGAISAVSGTPLVHVDLILSRMVR